jgi:hypothetical protein
MNFLKKLFSKSISQQDNSETKTDGETYIMTEKGAYVFDKEKEPPYTYSDLTETEYKHIAASVAILKDAFAPLLKFDKQPANHPENLDEYLTVWGSTGFDNFMDIKPDQHTAFLSYNFGQYLVDSYGMKWQTKSDGQGTATVVRLEKPVEIELYPIDRTLRAIQNKELAVYVGVEAKLRRALEQLGQR